MGVGGQQPSSLQQPLLGGDPNAAPSAPPLVQSTTGAYAAAAAPPGAYPPYDQQQQGSYPAALGTPHGAYAPIPPPPPPPPSARSVAYTAPMVQTHTTHIVAMSDQPLILQRVSRLAPALQMCPSCGRTGATRVRRERGCCTWLQAFGMCWLFCPLFWLPCCLDCSKDVVHRCSDCGAEVARITPC